VLKKLLQDEALLNDDSSIHLKEEKIDTSKLGQQWSKTINQRKEKSKVQNEPR